MSSARTVIVVGVLLGLMAVGAANAQEGLLNQAVQQGWLQCGIVGGRITLDQGQIPNIHTTTATHNSQHKEELHLQKENGRPTLRYERTNDKERLAVNMVGSAGSVLIHQEPLGDSPALTVKFEQTADQEITLTVGSWTQQQVFSAPDLWRLLIAWPEECRKHLLPLLEELRPDWSLADQIARVEERLLRNAEEDKTSDAASWAALVKQLADNSFAKREAADRALREGGPNAIAYLWQLDFDRLDAEQRFRVHRIIAAQTGQHGEDSAEQIVASLAGVPAVWLALLARSDPAIRRTAAKQLAKLLGGPISVDPAADPKTQKDKREQLRARIGGG